MDVTPVTGMALEDWLLEGEAIRFSAYDSYSKEEIAVTDRRLIFYHSSLTREEINAYNLSHIAGYKIIAVRRIELTILGGNNSSHKLNDPPSNTNLHNRN